MKTFSVPRLASTLSAAAVFALGTIGTVGLIAVSNQASAAAPQQKTQAPGFYRMALGDFEVTALFDGHFNLDEKLLKDLPAKELQKLKERSLITKTNFLTSVSAYLVNTGKQLILVDAGSATCFGQEQGQLPANLKAAGYSPEQVDLIVITHMHGDHICGATRSDGYALFPNAMLMVNQDDAKFWLNEEIDAKAPKEMQGFFKMARDSVHAYQANGKFKTFAAGEQLAPGMQVLDTRGHTPGHSSYQFTSQGQSLVVIGDLIHAHAVQLPRPQTGIVFDNDGKAAIPMRKQIFDNAAKNKTWVAASHMPFPGIGQVRSEGKSYVWLPVDFAPYGIGR